MRKVLNHGFVRLIEVLGDDSTVVKSARVSVGQETKGAEADKKLVAFLMTQGHESPFEHVVFQFHIKCPIFVARQWMRHRWGSYNEISGRYVQVKDEFYIPTDFRTQVGKNYEYENLPQEKSNELHLKYQNYIKWSYNFYTKLLDEGVSREQARIILPQGMFTEFYWTVNARALMNFVKLRADIHAQWEIREYGKILLEIMEEKLPWTTSAFLSKEFPKGL